MLHYLKNPIKHLPEHKYLLLVTCLIPSLNFLNGLLIDMYAPSMPHIASYFHTSSTMVKNTVTATIIGYGVGSFIFGIVFDIFGRKPVITIGLFLFIITNIFAVFTHNIDSLLFIRFLQGIIGGIMAIGSRILALDNFKDKRLTVVILYASLAFGIGTVIAPFIGGYLQHHFGWRSNFIVYILFTLCIMGLFVTYIDERYVRSKNFKIKTSLATYVQLLQNKPYLGGLAIMALVQFELLLFPTIGSFVIEKQLGYTAIVFGHVAFVTALGYLTGTLINRVLLKFYAQNRLINFAFKIQILLLIITIINSIFLKISVLSLIIPFTLLTFSVGFILGNVASIALQKFAKNASTAASINSTAMMLVAALLCYFVSFIHTYNLFTLCILFLPLIVGKIFLFNKYFKKL